MMTLKNLIITVCSIVLFSGCVASSIPLSSKISDVTMNNIKTSSAKIVGYEYKSDIVDGLIKPCDKDCREQNNSHPGFLHTESATLDAMLKNYLSMKFQNVDNSSNPMVKVKLKKFWIEHYSNDSSGQRLLVALGGGETNMTVVANMDLTFEVSKDGNVTTKNIRVSDDDVHVVGVGTNTSTSNLNRGRDSLEFRVANAMNAANNKTIIMLNQFIESNQL